MEAEAIIKDLRGALNQAAVELKEARESHKLSATGVCSILEACGKSGVRELKYKELEVSFAARIEAIDSAGRKVEIEPEAILAVQKKIHEESMMDEDLKDREEKLQSLLIEDPLAYEELMEKGELTDERNESSA